MKSEEVDKIIAEALEKENQRRHPHRRGGRSTSDKIILARKILNALFMLGFLVAVIVYFALPEEKALFFSIGFGAMLLKIAEFFLRFMF